MPLKLLITAFLLAWQAADSIVLKSPLRVACVGTKAMDCGGAVRVAVSWKPEKRKSLSFLTAPPMVAPYWFLRNES